jgi:DNA-binding transcriptional LysR family regulator
MTDRLREIEVFVRTAETGSFSRAARELGLSQPSASRLVSRLEQRLGARLLLRTTRRVRATEAGQRYLESARRALAELEDAHASASGDSGMRGSLRVALSTGFGCREIVPRLPQFLAAHPGLRLELIMADHQHDLVAEAADVALRLGALPDSAFVARRIARSPRFAVAAPGYLAARGTPAAPADLAAHDCIIGPGTSAAEGWIFRRGKTLRVAATGRTRINVTAAEGVTACARAGLGIALVAEWMCGRELEAGELVRVLSGFALAPVEAYAVFAAGQRAPSKARAFVDFVAAGLHS